MVDYIGSHRAYYLHVVETEVLITPIGGVDKTTGQPRFHASVADPSPTVIEYLLSSEAGEQALDSLIKSTEPSTGIDKGYPEKGQ